MHHPPPGTCSGGPCLWWKSIPKGCRSCRTCRTSCGTVPCDRYASWPWCSCCTCSACSCRRKRTGSCPCRGMRLAIRRCCKGACLPACRVPPPVPGSPCRAGWRRLRSGIRRRRRRLSCRQQERGRRSSRRCCPMPCRTWLLPMRCGSRRSLRHRRIRCLSCCTRWP